ncbi:MAG: ABC transporter substrate-binding protein [Conexibacter sp.]
MYRARKATALVVALIAVLALGTAFSACGDSSSPSGTKDAAEAKPGGTLRIGQTTDPTLDVFAPYNQQEQHWCCLNRNLYTYPLTPIDEGGADPVPDIAVDMPEISADGLTWTIKLKEGLRYSPPYDDREIVAGDFVRTVEFLTDPKNETVNMAGSGIAGVDPDSGKRVKGEKLGVTAVDDHTLVIKLTKGNGYFIHVLAFPPLTPFPEGALDGHEKDYGRYLIATGPYMVKGTDQLDPANPKPISGYVPGRSLTLVRNPSWDPKTDDVRKAYPDEIVFNFGDEASAIAQKVTNGELDVMFNDQAPPETIQQYRSNPDLKDRLHVNPKLTLRLTTINSAVAPFDDVHVRRAANFILNRQDIQRANGGPEAGAPAYGMYVAPTVLKGYDDYEPFKTSGPDEALEKAMEEMRQSKYDPGKTGKCTADVCKDIRSIPTKPDMPDTNIVRQDLAKIGLDLAIETYSADEAFNKCAEPRNKVALCIGINFGQIAADGFYPASDFMARYVGPNSCCNLSLAGTTREQLTEWGYPDSVPVPPNYDDQITRCEPLLDDERLQCLIDFAKVVGEQGFYLTMLYPQQREIIGSRIANYTYDMQGYLSLNQVALIQD